MIVLVTGGFDPIHSGHIAYLKAARNLGTQLVVGLNSDEWLTRKKGQPFMTWEERAYIISNLECVNRVIDFDDKDDTANNAIFKTLNMSYDNKIIFAKGGDRTMQSTPEYQVYGKTHWVDFRFGVGGEDKKNSSSWILDKWKTNRTERDWGYWRVLDDKSFVKVKELVINPHCSLSDQRHFHRSEHWYVLEGKVDIIMEDKTHTLNPHQTHIIRNEQWHQAINRYEHPCHVLEVQYGPTCEERDIERR